MMMILLFSSLGVVVQHVVVDVNEEEDIVVHRFLSCRWREMAEAVGKNITSGSGRF